jgi:hypothetical protein
VGGNDDSCGGSTSSVQWKTDEGEAYYIHGYAEAVGDFGMTITSFVTPKNDACLDSIVLSSSIDDTVVVSTAGSTPDAIPGCSSAFIIVPGTWCQMDGQGKVISVSTCSPLTNVASAISVFRGSCEDLLCVSEGTSDLLCVSEGTSDYTCQYGFATRAVFLAEEGNPYFILLQSSDEIGGDVGLTITEDEPPNNIQCTNSEGPLTPANQTIVASTLGSVSDGFSDSVFGFHNSAGLWYSVLGEEGLRYRVDTAPRKPTWTL